MQPCRARRAAGTAAAPATATVGDLGGGLRAGSGDAARGGFARSCTTAWGGDEDALPPFRSLALSRELQAGDPLPPALPLSQLGQHRRSLPFLSALASLAESIST